MMRMRKEEREAHPLIIQVQICYEKKCPCRIHNRCFFNGICKNQLRTK